ncbi:MAG: DUF2382 domain-containing protein [Friedmanniella sp.]
MTTNEPAGTDRGPAAGMVRSEEQLRVRTRTEATGRVRIRKTVTSQEVTRSATLRREELSVEELPVEADTDDNGRVADDGEGWEIELVLHEERLVVTTVPVERVRVRVHRVTDEVEVAEVLRRERIAFDVAPPAGTGS